MEFFFLFLLTTLFCLVYLALFFLFPYFFQGQIVKLSKKSLFSLTCLILLSLLAYAVSFSIPDQQLGNRLLHAFGGGFLALLTCFFVVRDTKLQINKFQFFVFGFLVATGLGVANELLEFVLQNTTHLIFAPSINDTWLDLASNTVGALLAAAILVPFCHCERSVAIQKSQK